MQRLRNIIVIGASAGGLPAIRQVIAGLSGQINASVFVVVHLSTKSSAQNIAQFFQKDTTLICRIAKDRAVIEKGHVYVAPPDHHLILVNNKLVVNHGPHENKYRPSIDVLFRSAAVAYGNKVIGIILTGLLEDGTSGMSAVKRCGGICMVQDPAEAEHPDMPLSVVNYVKVDYRLPLAEMPAVLNKLFTSPLPTKVPVPSELKIEADITKNRMSAIDQLKKIGSQSDFSCPDCGGSLWAVKNDPAHRYRCFTGHAYTEHALYELQRGHIEESIYVSVRMLEERRNLLKLMAVHAKADGRDETADANQVRADELNIHIDRLKSVLEKLADS